MDGSETRRRRLRFRRSGDAGLPARGRAARPRSAIAGPSALRRRVSCIPTSSRPIGAAASTSSRAWFKPDELADIEREPLDILDRLPAERARSSTPREAGAGGGLPGPQPSVSKRSAIRSAAPISPMAAIREDVRAAARRWREGDRLPHPGLAAILRGVLRVYGIRSFLPSPPRSTARISRRSTRPCS